MPRGCRVDTSVNTAARRFGLVFVLGCAPEAPAPVAAPGPVNAPVATWQGGSLSVADLEARLGDELQRMDAAYRVARYEKLHTALDAAVEEALVTEAAKAGGHASVEALILAEVDARLGEPTDEELAAEYARFVEQMPGTPFEQARPYLRKQLLETRRSERRQAFLTELKARASLQIDLPFPDVPRVDVSVRSDDPVLGSADAAVTIVEFGGFECLYCRRMQPTLRRLVEAFPGQVRVVIKDFPLPGHGRAEAASVAAHCAGDQDRYWEMSDLLFQHQGRFEARHLTEYAERLGLDVPRWQACVADSAWHQRVEEDVREGRRAGVQSTPSLFVNGMHVEGAHPYDRLAGLVQQELARLGAAEAGTR